MHMTIYNKEENLVEIENDLFKYDSNDCYVGRPYDSSRSPDEGWPSFMAHDEDYYLTPCAHFLEVIATIEIVIIVVRIQLWQVLVLSFSIRVWMIISFRHQNSHQQSLRFIYMADHLSVHSYQWSPTELFLLKMIATSKPRLASNNHKTVKTT